MAKLKEKIKTLPQTPGVYLFKNAGGRVLYVGKAVDLSRRVRQYFQKDDAAGAKTRLLVGEATDVEVTPTASEFDALLLEARLIRTQQPKYNVIARDDKSPIYLVLTLSDLLPRVIVARKTQLTQYAGKRRNMIFGPFGSARKLSQLIRTLRRIVPFCSQKKRNGRPCFYTHLGLCHPCPSVISTISPGPKRAQLREVYVKNIRRLGAILSGKSPAVRRALEQEMKNHARRERFEEAALLRDQVDSLYRLMTQHYDPETYLARGVESIFEVELGSLEKILSVFCPQIGRLGRIECIDISNFQGKEAVGSLVVLINGQPDPGQYRRFRIRGSTTANDVAMIKEVLRRRLTHSEWTYPNLLLVDGGQGQVAAAQSILSENGLDIPVAGLAKRREELIVEKGGKFEFVRLPLNYPAILPLLRIRDEAHRFALSYHRRLRQKLLTSV